MPKYIKADQFFYPHGIRRGGYLELIDRKFGKHVEELPDGVEVIDYTGYSVAHWSCRYSYSRIWWYRCYG